MTHASSNSAAICCKRCGFTRNEHDGFFLHHEFEEQFPHATRNRVTAEDVLHAVRERWHLYAGTPPLTEAQVAVSAEMASILHQFGENVDACTLPQT